MHLPSSESPPMTWEVGYFAVTARRLAEWLSVGMGAGWHLSAPAWDFGAAMKQLGHSQVLTKQLVVPVGTGWSAVLTDGPGGTDLGLLPSQAARKLGCTAVRATSVPRSEVAAAQIFEVYDPSGAAPLRLVRSVVAARDGDRWVFETSGTPYAFETVEQYKERRKADRFTADLLSQYLRHLGIPESAPRWEEALLVSAGQGTRRRLPRFGSSRPRTTVRPLGLSALEAHLDRWQTVAGQR